MKNENITMKTLKMLQSKIVMHPSSIVWVVFLLFCSFGFSQTLQTSIDSTQIKIGAQVNLTLKAKVKLSDLVVFPEPKYIGSLEVLESHPIDTIKKNNDLELIKKYGLTQFDSGVYKIPRIAVQINKKDFFSDSTSIRVNDVKVDTLKQPMFDIKDVIVTNKQNSDWWKYFLYVLFLALLGYLAYLFIKMIYKSKIEVAQKYTSPIEKAIAFSEELEKKQLWQNGNIKDYYSELTNIVRIYIEESMAIPAMESTSSELIEALIEETKNKKINLSNTTLDQFYSVLKNADLVKFAKSKPVQTEIETDKSIVATFIIDLEKAKPEEIIAQEQEIIEKTSVKKEVSQKNKRFFLTSLVIILFFLIASLTFAFTLGYDFLKENFIGYSAKEILDTDWVTSEYGDPAIKIETPRPLERILDPNWKDAKKSNPMSTFKYESTLNEYAIYLTTLKIDPNDSISEIIPDLVIENRIKKMESDGAKNIFTKTQSFETKTNNLRGLKAQGSFTQFNKEGKNPTKKKFEIVVFRQSKAIQEFFLIYNDNDKDAQQMMDKVINSIELKKTNW